MTSWFRRVPALFLLVVASCGGSGPIRSPSAASTAAPLDGTITVFAAASLAESFKAIGAAFTAAHPGAKVTFSFDASSALVTQLTEGAPADVFASADLSSMERLTKAGLNAGTTTVFATNVLSIIVPSANPRGIRGLADLADRSVKVVLCDASVPCGKYARQSLDASGVVVTPVSAEQNVKGVVTKVVAGEADAGIVYRTDVLAAGAKATGVVIPPEFNVVATYPIVPITTSKLPALDRAFVDFVAGADGRRILATYGFGTP